MLQAKIKLLDNELDRAYEENIGMKTANTDLEVGYFVNLVYFKS